MTNFRCVRSRRNASFSVSRTETVSSSEDAGNLAVKIDLHDLSKNEIFFSQCVFSALSLSAHLLSHRSFAKPGVIGGSVSVTTASTGGLPKCDCER